MTETEIYAAARKAEEQARALFDKIDANERHWTEKVIRAFAENRVSEACFAGTTGYGYDDLGRETIEKIFASLFDTECALVRSNFVNGTHAIACGILAPLSAGDVMLSVGPVYDTLMTLVGARGAVGGTFRDYGIEYREFPFEQNKPDIKALAAAASDAKVREVFIQRSPGYTARGGLSPEEIGKIAQAVKKVNPSAAVVVDNCYGEFCAPAEPTAFGADLCCGSLIKNPGGGIANCGGYVAGRADLVEKAAFRLTLPGIGGECGATLDNNRRILQGLFNAPHATAQALKTAVFAANLFSILGLSVSPGPDEARTDIIQTVDTGSEERLCALCRGIQSSSPVDSFASPVPAPMPGYDCPVIMAAGTFVQGSSLELSCDAPVRPPYRAYLQGGLTFEAGRYGVLNAALKMFL